MELDLLRQQFAAKIVKVKDEMRKEFLNELSLLRKEFCQEFTLMRQEQKSGFAALLGTFERTTSGEQRSQISTRSATSAAAAVSNGSHSTDDTSRAFNLLARNMEQPAEEQNSDLKGKVVEMICVMLDGDSSSAATKADVEQSIVSVQRVGNSAGRTTPLPVKIIFKSVEHRVSAHRSAYRLGQPNNKFKGISLDSDITQDQQYSRQLLKAELAKANNLMTKDIRISWSCTNPLRATKVKLPNGDILPRLSQQNVQAAVY